MSGAFGVKLKIKRGLTKASPDMGALIRPIDQMCAKMVYNAIIERLF